MKFYKKLMIMGLVTFTLEGLFLFYIDKYYLAEEQAIKIENVTEGTKVVEVQKPAIKLPEQYKDFKVSYDGAYVSYFEDGVLKIVNMKDGKSSDINFAQETEQSYYGWLDDRNRIIIAEKKPNANKKKVVKFSHYDVKSQEKVEVRDFINDKEVYLSLESNDAEVRKIEFNTLNTIIFPQISVNDKESQLYRVDATAPIEQIKTSTKNIGDIRVLKNLDKIIYEDNQNKKLYISGNKNPININGVTEYELLSVDEQSAIYVGGQQDGKINKIYYKNAKDSDEYWVSVSIETPVGAERLYIAPSGEIYVDDPSKQVLTNIKTMQQLSYSGKILGIHKGGFIVMNSKYEISNLSFLNSK